MPCELPSPFDEGRLEFELLHVPLPCRDDLERPFAPFVELHDVPDGLRFTHQMTGLCQQLRYPATGPLRRQAGDLALRRVRGVDIPRWPARFAPPGRSDRPVALHHHARRQMELAPPLHVRDVAERADHRHAGSLPRVGELVRHQRNLRGEQRRHERRADQVPVTSVRGVHDERDARRDQLGSGRLDLDARPPIGTVEPNAVVRALDLTVLDLRLGDRRLEVDVPHRGRVSLVGEPAAHEIEEAAL
jgi:hypothetical protein